MSSNSHREGFDKKQDIQFLFYNLTRDAKSKYNLPCPLVSIILDINIVIRVNSTLVYYNTISFQSYPPLSHCRPQPPICHLCYQRLSNPPPMTSALRLGPSLAAAGFNKPATSPSPLPQPSCTPALSPTRPARLCTARLTGSGEHFKFREKINTFLLKYYLYKYTPFWHTLRTED